MSDLPSPLGDPFIPGTCFFEVVARGTYRDADGIDVYFEVKGGVQFELTP